MPSTAITFDLDAGFGPLRNLDYSDGAGAQASASADDSTGPSLARFRFVNGDVAITSVAFAGGGIAGTPAIELAWDGPDEAVLINRAPYAALPSLEITAFTGFVLDIRGFRDVTITRQRPADQFIVLDGVETGAVTTTAGDDVVVVGLDGALPASGGDFAVATGTGGDVVFFVGSVENYGGWGVPLSTRATTTALGRGDDFFVGGRTLDLVAGEAGDDSLEGFAGADRLTGGRGADTLAGGAGADVFVYGDAAEGGDTLVGFRSGVDAIAVSAAGFGLTAGEDLAAGRFVANRAGVATEAFGQFVFDRDDGLLWWDADGTGADPAALLASIGRVAAADILVLA